MGRRKIQIKKIPDEKTLLVTFAKRKKGLYNKAFELGELCDCEIAVIIFTNKNCMHTYSSHNLDETVKRYKQRQDRTGHTSREEILKRRTESGSSINGNAASSNYSQTAVLNNPSLVQMNPSSSRAGTTSSINYFDDQNIPNNILTKDFHNGSDNFSTNTSDFGDDPGEQRFGQLDTSLEFPIDRKPNVCSSSGSKDLHDNMASIMTEVYIDDFDDNSDPRKQTYGHLSSSPAYQINDKSSVCAPSGSIPLHYDTTDSRTPVMSFDGAVLNRYWVTSTDKVSTSTKPPLETPDPQQVGSSPLRK